MLIELAASVDWGWQPGQVQVGLQLGFRLGLLCCCTHRKLCSSCFTPRYQR